MKVIHYSQVRQVEWSLSLTIIQTDKFKLKTIASDDTQKITVNTLQLLNEQKYCKDLLSAEIIDADSIYSFSCCENMSCKTIVKKGANCTVKVDTGIIGQYFLNEKPLADAGELKLY